MAVRGVLQWTKACVLLQLCMCGAVAAASGTSRSYYDILNIEATATDRQIKKAFRRLALKYHPDKNKSDDAEKTFRQITEAYMVLSSKEKRRLYDSVGHEAFLNEDEASVDPEDEQEMSFLHSSFADLFHDFHDGPHFHWGFQPDAENEDGLSSFEMPSFTIYFGDEDENEEDHFY